MRIALFNRVDALDDQINGTLARMAQTDEESEEYAKLLGQLEKLEKLRNSRGPKKLDRNTLALVAGNLLGILIIVAYEQRHVMTSKAFNERVKVTSPRGD